MSNRLATPGVYVIEKNAFPSSVAAVPTAVPAFIGYTQNTSKDGKTLINKPVRVTSLAEYIEIFGTGATTTFHIEEDKAEIAPDFKVKDKFFKVVPDNSERFILFDSIRLFFSNGGGTCYIVSAGGYTKKVKTPTPPPPASGGSGTPKASSSDAPQPNKVTKKALEEGLMTLIAEDEPTMVVIPEAIMLEKDDCYALQQAMLQHCGYKMKDRVAILDVYDGLKARTYDDEDIIKQFREKVGNNYLSFGTAYYPWVLTSIVQKEEMSYKNISNASLLIAVLSAEIDEIISDKGRATEMKDEIKKISDSKVDAESLNQTLTAISPAFKIIQDRLKTHLNILPPSAGMAGIYTAVDNQIGVWKSPANVGFNSVVTPVVKMTNDDQEDLNISPTGKSVNGIRFFVGEGTKVWGARTLDGNSQDWRYINVRRTLLFIEQSVKLAAKVYVFEPNTANTWVLVNSMISSFLNNIWRQGGLAGSNPDQAFEVEVGLGTTMTPNDILDGIMRITVKVAVVRPAEFIVITFQQKMQES